MFREKISVDRRTQVLVNNLTFELFNLSTILYHSPVPLLSLIILNIFFRKDPTTRHDGVFPGRAR